MTKKHWIFIIISVLLFVLLVALEGTRKKPVSWQLSFSAKDKIPYGSYVLKDALKSLYPNKKFTENNDGLFLYKRYHPYPENSSFIFITRFFSIDKLDFSALLSFARRGNDIFISAENFSDNIKDSLKFNASYEWMHQLDSTKITHLYFTDKALANDTGYRVKPAFSEFRFDWYDSSKTTVLGIDNYKFTNFIKVKQGKGNVYLSTTPLLYTNYNILYGNYRYPFTALSYLKGDAVVWDEYYKPDKPEVSSPIGFLLSQPSLKAAYYLLIITLFLYMIFGGKRKQRIIPVIEAPQNMSLAFANTLGRLYFNSGNNRDIALKKYSYFCDYLRNKFYVKTITEEKDFLKDLAERSGVPVETISDIIVFARVINNTSWIMDSDLINFNSKIEEFYNKTK